MRTPDDTNHWESEMGDEFQRRVRDLHEAPLDLSSVKEAAMKVRNRRRAAVAGGILAAAAVVVPVAVLATTGADRADGLDPAAPSVSVTDTAAPSPSQDPSEVDTEVSPAPGVPDDLSRGFDYLEVGSGNTVLHQGDGGVVELPGRGYTGAASLGSTVAGYRVDNEGSGAVDLIDDGAVTTTYTLRSAMVTAPDGRTVAFITTDDELVFVNADLGEQPFGTIEPGINLSAIIGNGDCALEAGCHPFLEYDDFTQDEAFEINAEGPDTAPAPGALRVNDADDHFLVSVQTESTDTGSCGGLYDREGGGRWIFRTCASQVLDISPTGEYVVGTDPYGDGIGPRYFSILDAGDDGKEVARYETDPGFVIGTYAWTDDTHVVAVVNDDGAWTTVSLGVDGSVEELAGPVDGVDFPEPFVIAH